MAGTKRKNNHKTSQSKRSNTIEENDINDDMSTDTAQVSNTELIYHNHATFLLIRTAVPQSKKGTETMKKQFSTEMQTSRYLLCFH